MENSLLLTIVEAVEPRPGFCNLGEHLFDTSLPQRRPGSFAGDLEEPIPGDDDPLMGPIGSDLITLGHPVFEETPPALDGCNLSASGNRSTQTSCLDVVDLSVDPHGGLIAVEFIAQRSNRSLLR